MLYFLKKKGIIYTNYNWIFLRRFVKKNFFQEIWALGKMIYFIYKIFFFLNLTEIMK